MSYEILTACAEQKIILLKKIKELSKEIELHSSEPGYSLTELPQQRQMFIDRLQKCDELLYTQINRQAPEDQERIHRILSVGGNESARGAEELALYESGVKFRSILRDILAMDSVSIQRIKAEQEQLKKQMGHTKNTNGRDLFSYSVH
jgi:hypothetical protein